MTDLAPASALLTSLARTIARGGWEIVSLEINACSARGRIELRRHDLFVTFDATEHRASTTRETQERYTALVGRRGDRMPVSRIRMRLLGRQRHLGLRNGLKWLSNYLADNSDGRLTGVAVRQSLGPVLESSTTNRTIIFKKPGDPCCG